MKIKSKNKHRLLPTLVILCFCLLVTIQSASAQSGTVIMPMREATVKQAFDNLQRQTDYTIVVDWGNLGPEKRVLFPAHEVEITELLKICLSGSNSQWKVVNNRIVITPSEPTSNERGAQSVMHRNGYASERMTFVPDPYSHTQKPFENMVNTRKTYWNNDGTGTDSVGLAVINYRVNSSLVEADYMNNARTFEIIRRTLMNKEVLASLDYIVITAASSPEGNTAANQALAAKRALALKSYLMWKYPYLNRDIIYTFSLGEDWSGLRRMVLEDYSVPGREEVLDVIDSPISNDAKRAGLKAIANGRAYSYIAARFLPKLRGAAACTLHYKEPLPCVENPIIASSVDTVYIEREVVVTQDCELERKPLFAIKTNLLFDVATALNVEIEVPLGKRFSIAGEYIFPWWLNEDKQRALQLISGNLELRYWFGNRAERPVMTGWYMGLYGGGGYFDIEWETKGYQGEFFIAAGVSGGYAHTISKNGNWRMEYGLGAGYMQTKYREYVPKFGLDDEWHLIRQRDGVHKWFGPTKAKVSLVWMINHGYKKKGGAK